MLVHPSQRYRLYIDETGTQTLKRGLKVFDLYSSAFLK